MNIDNSLFLSLHNTDASKRDVKGTAELINVAEQFEALFVEQLLQAARQSNLDDGLFENEETNTYREMLDKEYAKNIAKNAPLGIADAIQQQFGRHIKEE